MKEVLQLAELRAKQKKTLQKIFARGWELLIQQLELDRYIRKSDLCKQLGISAAETEEFISKLAWVCRKHQLPCLADVIVPDDDDSKKTFHGPIKRSNAVFIIGSIRYPTRKSKYSKHSKSL